MVHLLGIGTNELDRLQNIRYEFVVSQRIDGEWKIVNVFPLRRKAESFIYDRSGCFRVDRRRIG